MKILLALGLSLLSINSAADEGMWTLNNFPVRDVKAKYNFDASKAWLDHLQLSAARLAGGCSASFVSKAGLIMTNHHCLLSCIEQISTASHDFMSSGFYAKKPGDEVKCPEIEINKLVEIKDVTRAVNDITKNAKNFEQALKAATSSIERECAKDSDFDRCEVISFYNRGQYNLYHYRRYQDVRLVFAPEFSIAFFGGYADNFNFPRYNFDVSFLRVYEKNKPLETKDFYKWSVKGAQDGELSFVTGNPGSTSRLLTVAELEYARDTGLMTALLETAELRGFLTEFQNRGLEQKRISNEKLYGVENDLKVLKGRLSSLLESNIVKKRMVEEKALRAKVNANPKLKKLYGSAWQEIESSYKEFKDLSREVDAIEKNSFGSRLFRIAKNLVRASEEIPKKNEIRLKEYRDSHLPQLKQSLLNPAPINDEFEIAIMTYHLTKLREKLGADHSFIKTILGKSSPAEVANNLVRSTLLKPVENRSNLFNGGKVAIEKSTDRMILFAQAIDSEARRRQKNLEEGVGAVIKKADEKVANAHFAVYGARTYPEANFTMRISYGAVKGFQEKDKFIKPFTIIQGAFERHTGRDPLTLPESWLKAKPKLNLETPFNFISTNDVIGGNSGSPVINKEAEIIGLIFDGNVHSLSGVYGYDQKLSRAVAVHSAAVIEVLKNAYGADRVVNEISQK